MEVDVKLLAQVFRAAAGGAVAQYWPPPDWDYTANGMWMNGSYTTHERAHAESMAGVFNAIADIFEKMSTPPPAYEVRLEPVKFVSII